MLFRSNAAGFPSVGPRGSLNLETHSRLTIAKGGDRTAGDHTVLTIASARHQTIRKPDVASGGLRINRRGASDVLDILVADRVDDDHVDRAELVGLRIVVEQEGHFNVTVPVIRGVGDRGLPYRRP